MEKGIFRGAQSDPDPILVLQASLSRGVLV